MPKGTMYFPIATNTLGVASSSVTFSSIPATYTDLYLVVQYMSSINSGCYLRYNNDSNNNYSVVNAGGSGNSTFTYATANQNVVWADTYISGTGTVQTDRPIVKANIMNYANTTTYKTTLCRGDDVRTTSADAGSVYLGACTWRNTSAINRIDVISQAGNFIVGSTFNLYGVLAA